MNKLTFIICILFSLISIFPAFGENELIRELYEIIEENTSISEDSKDRILFLPGLSYNFVTFDNVTIHDSSASLTILRFNPEEKNKMLAISLMYNPDILTHDSSDYPSLYHGAALSIMQKKDRHLFNIAFMPMTDKPLYGGSHSSMGAAAYSYNLIKGNHFSMDLGAGLLFLDIDVKLNNGMPWMLWPLPMFSFSWEYEWFTFDFLPGSKLVIAPKKPISLIFTSNSNEYDASLWYKHFKDKNPSKEIMGIGFGVKNNTNNVIMAGGERYGIAYNALYGAVRVFKLLEVKGGWAFNGKEGDYRMNWNTLFNAAGYSGRYMYDRRIGNGYFVSFSARVNM